MIASAPPPGGPGAPAGRPGEWPDPSPAVLTEALATVRRLDRQLPQDPAILGALAQVLAVRAAHLELLHQVDGVLGASSLLPATPMARLALFLTGPGSVAAEIHQRLQITGIPDTVPAVIRPPRPR